jgi:hypothetical protein
MHTVKGEKWLEVKEMKQSGKTGFAPIGAQNAWMPESGGAGNGAYVRIYLLSLLLSSSPSSPSSSSSLPLPSHTISANHITI